MLVSDTTAMMQIGAGAMLVVLSIITCGGGRPIGYEPISYGAVDVDPPAREFSDFDDEDVVSEWVNPLHVIGDTAGTRACAGFLCTWRLHNEITTPAPQVSGPIEHEYLGKNMFSHLYKLFFYDGGQSNYPGSPN